MRFLTEFSSSEQQPLSSGGSPAKSSKKNNKFSLGKVLVLLGVAVIGGALVIFLLISAGNVSIKGQEFQGNGTASIENGSMSVDDGMGSTPMLSTPSGAELNMTPQNEPEGGPVLTLTPDIVTQTAIPTEKPLTQEEMAWVDNAGLNIQNLLSSGQLNRDGLKGNVYFIAEEGRADNPKLLEEVIKLMKLASSGAPINLSELKEPIIISKLFTPLSLEGVTLNKVALEQFEKEGCMILVSFDSWDHRVDDIDPDLYVKVGRYGLDNKWDYRGGVRNIVFGFKGGDASSFIKTWDELTIPKAEGVEGSEELWLTPDLAPKDRFDEIRLQNAKLIIVIPPNVDFKTFVRENIPPKDDTTLFTLNFMTIIKSDQMSDD